MTGSGSHRRRSWRRTAASLTAYGLVLTAAVPAFVGIASADVGSAAPGGGGASAGAPGAAGGGPGAAGGGNSSNVTICHATAAETNPYVEITVDESAVDGNGANDHTLHTGPLWQPGDKAAGVTWGDIIPPNPATGYPGSEAYLAGGDAWLAAGCVAPGTAVVGPTATVTGTCTAADFTLAAGSAPVTFTITTAGRPTPTTVPLTAGQTRHALVTLDAAHPAATATATGLAPVTFTRDAGCDGSGGTGGAGGSTSGSTGGGGSPGTVDVANPGVTASTACATGITVVLTDAGGTAPATFAVVSSSGRVLAVTVAPDQTVRRSFAVAEDTTGQVTVSAPGLTARTFRYAKDCTAVLGEKQVRHHRHRHQRTDAAVTPTGVAGEQAGPAPALPFTGAPTGQLAALALGLLVLGSCLVRTGRQPYPGRHRT